MSQRGAGYPFSLLYENIPECGVVHVPVFTHHKGPDPGWSANEEKVASGNFHGTLRTWDQGPPTPRGEGCMSECVNIQHECEARPVTQEWISVLGFSASGGETTVGGLCVP
jgi:hypothetical protein